MKTINFVLSLAAVAFAATIQICNVRTCYEQQIEASRYEWLKTFSGDKFLRVYKPDGTIVDITGSDLKIEMPKKQKVIRRKHK